MSYANLRLNLCDECDARASAQWTRWKTFIRVLVLQRMPDEGSGTEVQAEATTDPDFPGRNRRKKGPLSELPTRDFLTTSRAQEDVSAPLPHQSMRK